MLAPPSLARLRSAGFRFNCPDPEPSGMALTLDKVPTDDCTAPDDPSFGSSGFFFLVDTESVRMPF